MKNTYEKSKEFLDNFDDLKDYSDISKKLEEICLCILEKQNINKQIKVIFEDNKAFGNFATEYPDKLSFNKLRYNTIKSLRIDCTSNNQLKQLYDFYNHYDENADAMSGLIAIDNKKSKTIFRFTFFIV